MVKGFCPCSDFVISFACDGFYGYGEEANVQLKLATSKGVVFYLSVDGTTVMMMLSFLSYQIEMANILEKLGMSRYDLFSLVAPEGDNKSTTRVASMSGGAAPLQVWSVQGCVTDRSPAADGVRNLCIFTCTMQATLG
ncbi:hypothetical protein V6N12_003380 [Hibiscus sabdariffa]|uniref:Uncharacterized protein n=1 Tax=Hibiscus sabdariffa TaxID=183260 RepID=A0ABR2B5A6_9ROSI